MPTKYYSSTTLQIEKSETDWNVVDLLTDQDIEQAVTDDPDTSILSPEQFKQMRPASEILPNLIKPSTSPKITTTLSLSPEVLVYFKSKGLTWQTQIDEILKQYIIQHQL